LLEFNTTPFELFANDPFLKKLFAKELPEGPEGKHWLARENWIFGTHKH